VAFFDDLDDGYHMVGYQSCYLLLCHWIHMTTHLVHSIKLTLIQCLLV
jgi:hypothetical protein